MGHMAPSAVTVPQYNVTVYCCCCRAAVLAVCAMQIRSQISELEQQLASAVAKQQGMNGVAAAGPAAASSTAAAPAQPQPAAAAPSAPAARAATASSSGLPSSEPLFATAATAPLPPVSQQPAAQSQPAAVRPASASSAGSIKPGVAAAASPLLARLFGGLWGDSAQKPATAATAAAAAVAAGSAPSDASEYASASGGGSSAAGSGAEARELSFGSTGGAEAESEDRAAVAEPAAAVPPQKQQQQQLSLREVKARLMHTLTAIKQAESGGYFDRNAVAKVRGTGALIGIRTASFLDVEASAAPPLPGAPRCSTACSCGGVPASWLLGIRRPSGGATAKSGSPFLATGSVSSVCNKE